MKLSRFVPRSVGKWMPLMIALVASSLTREAAAQKRFDSRRDVPHAKVSLGVRGQGWSSSGFDPYSGSDFTGALSLGADATLLRRQRFSLAAGFGWDFSTFNDSMRGQDFNFTVHRLQVPIEGRWHLAHWLYGFGKVSPGMVVSRASVQLEPDVGRYSDTRFAFATDLAVGAAFGVSPAYSRYGQRHPVRLWLQPELGWSLAGKTTYALTPPDERPDSDGVLLPGTTVATRLPGFSASGPFFRISLALAF